MPRHTCDRRARYARASKLAATRAAYNNVRNLYGLCYPEKIYVHCVIVSYIERQRVEISRSSEDVAEKCENLPLCITYLGKIEDEPPLVTLDSPCRVSAAAY